MYRINLDDEIIELDIEGGFPGSALISGTTTNLWEPNVVIFPAKFYKKAKLLRKPTLAREGLVYLRKGWYFKTIKAIPTKNELLSEERSK